MTGEIKRQVIPVILSGGSGTRLWPMSRKQYPKQFIDITGTGKTMLQMSALRTQSFGGPIVICSEEHRFIVGEQLQDVGIKPRAIILEPVARNTTAAIASAALFAKSLSEDAIIAVFPADHLIKDESKFLNSLKDGIEASNLGKLVTFGVSPDKPETGYGYIRTAKQAFGRVHPVEEFVEKPAYETALTYLAQGNYQWNSGMFMFGAETLLRELSSFEPDIINSCKESLDNAKSDMDFLRLEHSAFSKCKNVSIDYALMEKSKNVVSVELDVGWSDIGSWQSIWQESGKDANDNVVFGDAILQETSGCLIHANEKFTAVVGAKDLVIVDTDDSLLIIDKNQSQEVKSIVNYLEQQSRSERLHHRNVHRPWGSYDAIKCGERYQVKQLLVKPGSSMSLQLHHHRAEHWVVVEGTAKVIVGEKTLILTENESVYIPVGEKHQLSNPGKVPLKVIEVQSGAYLGEDDIVRFDDPYNRE